MSSHKARVYYDLEGIPHTWVQLSGPDGATETRGFAPAIYSPVWKGRVNDDTDHQWTLYREYDITMTQYREMQRVIDNWEGRDLPYVFGQRDCRDLVSDVMAKRGGHDGASGYTFNSQAEITYTVEGSVMIFKELGNDRSLLNDLSMKIRSQGPGRDLLNGYEAQEAMESGYWPGPYGHSPGM